MTLIKEGPETQKEGPESTSTPLFVVSKSHHIETHLLDVLEVTLTLVKGEARLVSTSILSFVLNGHNIYFELMIIIVTLMPVCFYTINKICNEIKSLERSCRTKKVLFF